jgi:adenylate cyclase
MRDGFISAFAISLATAALLLQPSFVVEGDWRTYDLLNGLGGSVTPSGQVAIVKVDDASLAKLGRWPWPRDVLGQVIRKLIDGGVRAVVLDVMFPEPDFSRPGLAQLAERGVEGIDGKAPGKRRTNDEALAEAIGDGRVVVGYYFDFRSAGAGGHCRLQPVSMAIATHDGVGGPGFYKASGALCTLPAITRRAAGTGFLNASSDSDGQLRRVPLLLEYKRRTYPSLALTTLLALRRKTTVLWTSGGMGVHHIDVDGLRIPLDAQGRLLIRFRSGRGAFPSVSAADVMSASPVAATLADKVVILGGSAAGLQDMAATPVDPMMLGVEVQAHLIDNMLTGDFVRRSGLSRFWEGLLIVICVAAMTILLKRVKPLLGSLILIALLAALWGGAALTLSLTREFVSPFLPAGALAGTFAILTVSNWSRQKAIAERTKQDLAAMRRFTIASLMAMVEARSTETSEHARRLQRYMMLLCAELEDHPRFRRFLTPKAVALLIELTPLHDIGKLGVPDSILHKNGPLTEEEIVIVRRHVEYGRKILENAYRESGMQDENLLTQARDIVSGHHERWDGSGYPNGLKGDAIPIPARLVALADVYDALVSKRAYKVALRPETARETIKGGRGTDFDPDVVDAFLANHEAWESEAERSRDYVAGRAAGA